jgi:FkbM family methyltransferase
MGLTHTAHTFKNLVQLSWRYRRNYASPADAFKGFLMRTALGRQGQKILKQREVEIHVRGSNEPLFLRRTTSDFQIFMMLFEQGEYDEVAKLSLPASPTVFDLGGNVGLATRRLSMLFPAARFLSVEPDSENRRLLTKNNQFLIDAGRLTVVGGFVAPADGVATIDRSDGSASMYRMRQANPQDKEIITCYSVPTLMQKVAATSVDLLKVDIEGAEAKLFESCEAWIGNVACIVVECDPPYTHDLFLADLTRANWKPEVVFRRGDVICVRRG